MEYHMYQNPPAALLQHWDHPLVKVLLGTAVTAGTGALFYHSDNAQRYGRKLIGYGQKTRAIKMSQYNPSPNYPTWKLFGRLPPEPTSPVDFTLLKHIGLSAVIEQTQTPTTITAPPVWPASFDTGPTYILSAGQSQNASLPIDSTCAFSPKIIAAFILTVIGLGITTVNSYITQRKALADKSSRHEAMTALLEAQIRSLQQENQALMGLITSTYSQHEAKRSVRSESISQKDPEEQKAKDDPIAQLIQQLTYTTDSLESSQKSIDQFGRDMQAVPQQVKQKDTLGVPAVPRPHAIKKKAKRSVRQARRKAVSVKRCVRKHIECQISDQEVEDSEWLDLSEREALVEEKKELMTKNEELESELFSKNKALATKDAAIATKDSELATKDAAIATKSAELGTKTELLTAKENEIIAKDNQLTIKLNELSQLRNDHSKHVKEIEAKHEDQLTSLTFDVASLERKILDLKQERLAKTIQMNKLMQERNYFQHHLQKSEEAFRQASIFRQESAQLLEQAKKSHKINIAAKDDEIKGLNAKTILKDIELQTLTENLRSTEHKVEMVTEALAWKTYDNKIIRQDLASRNKEIQKLTADVLSKDSKIQVLTAHVASREEDIRLLTTENALEKHVIQTLSQERGYLQSVIKVTLADHARQSRLAKLKYAIRQHVATLKVEQMAARKVERLTKEKDARIRALKDDHAQQMKVLTQALSSKQSDVEGKDRQIQDLQEYVACLKTEAKIKESAHEGIVDKMTTEKCVLAKQLQDAQKQIEGLQSSQNDQMSRIQQFETQHEKFEKLHEAMKVEIADQAAQLVASHQETDRLERERELKQQVHDQKGLESEGVEQDSCKQLHRAREKDDKRVELGNRSEGPMADLAETATNTTRRVKENKESLTETSASSNQLPLPRVSYDCSSRNLKEKLMVEFELREQLGRSSEFTRTYGLELRTYPIDKVVQLKLPWDDRLYEGIGLPLPTSEEERSAGNSVDFIECSFCHEYYTGGNSGNFHNHMKVCKSFFTTAVYCFGCDRVFLRNPAFYDEHLSGPCGTHPQKKCSKCRLMYIDQEKHEQVCLKDYYVCKTCGQDLVNDSAEDRHEHLRSCRSFGKQFRCQHCGKVPSHLPAVKEEREKHYKSCGIAHGNLDANGKWIKKVITNESPPTSTTPRATPSRTPASANARSTARTPIPTGPRNPTGTSVPTGPRSYNQRAYFSPARPDLRPHTTFTPSPSSGYASTYAHAGNQSPPFESSPYMHTPHTPPCCNNARYHHQNEPADPYFHSHHSQIQCHRGSASPQQGFGSPQGSRFAHYDPGHYAPHHGRR